MRIRPARLSPGFTILEVMLAVMIFGIAVLGLLTSLSTTIETAGSFAREGKIALSMQTQLAEAKEIDFEPGTQTDGPDEMGVLYTRDITPLQMENENGQSLDGLYSIRITAVWGLGGPDQTQTAEIYVYKP